MGVFLKRVSQIGVGVESSEGVAATNASPTAGSPSYIVDSSVVNPYQRRYKDASASVEFTETDVTRDKASLTPDVSVRGPGIAMFKWTEDMVGGSVSAYGTWGPPLRACGFAGTLGSGIKKITHAAPTQGSFAAGQIIGDNMAQGSATKTGFVVGVGTIGSTRTIWYKPLTGTFASTDTLYNYGQATQGIATAASNPANGGHKFSLVTETGSTTPDSDTVEMRDGEQIIRGVGCRGNATITLSHGDVPTISFDLKGPAQLKNENKELLAAGFVSGVPALSAPTLVVGDVTGVGVPFIVDNFSPIMTQMTIDLGNQVTDRKTISQGGVLAYLAEGTNCGYAATRITGRKPKATIDPEYPAKSTYDVFQKYGKGTTFPVLAQIGALRATGNQAVVFYSPKGQFAGNMQQADRDGITTFSGEVNLCGDIDDELEIYHLFA